MYIDIDMPMYLFFLMLKFQRFIEKAIGKAGIDWLFPWSSCQWRNIRYLQLHVRSFI